MKLYLKLVSTDAKWEELEIEPLWPSCGKLGLNKNSGTILNIVVLGSKISRNCAIRVIFCTKLCKLYDDGMLVSDLVGARPGRRIGPLLARLCRSRYSYRVRLVLTAL